MKMKLICLGVILIICITALCGCGNNNGTFYSLHEAYDNGWLTVEDLQSIAIYYRESDNKNFTPMPKVPETLSKATEKRIKKVYFNDLKKDVPEAKLKDVRIGSYYGTYGKSVAVSVWDDYRFYDLMFIEEELIGGVLFHNYCEREIYVWVVD